MALGYGFAFVAFNDVGKAFELGGEGGGGGGGGGGGAVGAAAGAAAVRVAAGVAEAAESRLGRRSAPADFFGC